MEYEEALEYIQKVQSRLGSDYSLLEVTELAKRFGRPDRKSKVIHIAGTNGKGSVGTDISAILAASGYTVGRYVSPTLFDYRERIQRVTASGDEITSEYISKEDTAVLLTRLQKECERMVQDGFEQPTAFEIETVLAFLMFAQWQVDVAVVETGMGGRLDATNIVEHPLLCVFTAISMDHMKLLGDSVPKIAQEKYGIIQEGTQVVSKRQKECCALLEASCQKKKASLTYMEETQLLLCQTAIEKTSFTYRETMYEMRQAGTYQAENGAIAIEAAQKLKALGFGRITQETIKEGLWKSRWKGRFDVVSEKPFVLADGAHNEEAAKRLADSLQCYFPEETFRFVIGVFADKEYEKVIEHLLPLASEVYTVTAPGERGLPSQALRESVLRGRDRQSTLGQTRLEREAVCAFDTVIQALEAVRSSGSEKKTIVCGSLSILGETYRYLQLYC